MSRIGRYVLYGVAVLARIAGRYEPCWQSWLFWPVPVVVMTHIGRYLPYGVAVLSRIGGRYAPYWPLFDV